MSPEWWTEERHLITNLHIFPDGGTIELYGKLITCLDITGFPHTEEWEYAVVYWIHRVPTLIRRIRKGKVIDKIEGE